MIKSNRIFATSMAVLCAFCARDARAAQNAPTLMSKYGEIQSVNKYSSNPFWTPNSPYNQRMPTPIYATGADLTAGDCNRIVGNLVSEYCAEHNYCSGSRLADVRPTVMVQLSQLPGHNFATSCGGYIDSIFENYKKTRGNTSTNNVAVPSQQTTTTIQIENPFKQTKSEYEIGVADRAAELESLQRQTTPSAELSATAFPKTIDDLSFTDRVANTTAGYEPYKDLSAYKTPKFETEDEYYERMKSVLTHKITYIGAGAPGCPKEYLTGRGETVSCAPTRQHGTCTAWCIDAARTDCNTEYKISPNDRDNKTFYGNCVCDTGYEDDGYKCVKPGTADPVDPVNPVDPIDPVDPTPNNCPDPHMDPTDCICKSPYELDNSSGKCKCDSDHQFGDPDDNCNDPANPQNAPQCLIDVANDSTFTSEMETNLNGVTDLNKWMLNNKQTFYGLAAEMIVEHCIKKSANLNEFNAFLDTNAPMPIFVVFNGKRNTIFVDKLELFDYTNYWTYPIVIMNKGVKDIGTNMPKSVVSLPNIVPNCTGNGYFIYKMNPLAYMGGSNAIIAGARPVYPAIKGEGFVLGKVHFPGQVYNISRWNTWQIVATENYAQAREQIKQFADGVNANGACAGNNMVIYLVGEMLPDAEKPDTARIVSEPFFIR